MSLLLSACCRIPVLACRLLSPLSREHCWPFVVAAMFACARLHIGCRLRSHLVSCYRLAAGTDETTANGFEPEYVANETLKAVSAKKRDVRLACRSFPGLSLFSCLVPVAAWSALVLALVPALSVSYTVCCVSRSPWLLVRGPKRFPSVSSSVSFYLSMFRL